jgi:serine/threonine-protein kinase
MTFAAGTRLGAYEIIGSLGVGGMGEVYRAKDTKLGRDVAIKTLPSALAKDHDRLARFEREAKLLAALNHPHIATVHALDEHDGTLYVAMELVEGETLEQKLKAGALPVDEALRFGLQIAEALEAAHGKGVIHRDLKPANVMVTRDGQVKVLDFGLAKAFSGTAEEASPLHSPALSVAMTQKGLVLGTAGYMAPEQASGQATDQRADIWAFGVVLYEMLTGLPLFSGESVPHVLADVLKTEPDWRRLPKNLHPRLRLLLERCLTKKPRNRLHSIADARVEIEAVLGDPRGVTPEPMVAAAAAKSSNTLRLAGAVALTAAVAGVAGWLLRPAPAPEPKPVNRLVYPVPETQAFRNAGRLVMALSPDGRRFVYNTFDGLYVRSMDTLEARLIPGTEENLTNPFFSADGQSIAYYAASGALKRVALSGGAPVVIASGVTNPFGASWASDGTILFGQPDGIYRVPANGGTPELVIPAQEGEQLYGPELLSDGDSVLFSARTTGNWDQAQIAAQAFSTGQRTGLVSGGSDARSVSTGHVIYALGDGLFAVAFDEATLTVAGGAVSLVQGVARAPVAAAAAAVNFGISNDGTLVYLSGAAAELPAWTPVWVDRNGNEDPLGLAPCVCASPAVSPDGARLAYDFPTATQTDSDVWVWSLAQRTNTRLTFEPGFQLGSLWSPDSTRIAHSSLGQGLFVRPADGTGMPEQLLESSSAPPPIAWAWTAADELIISELTASAGLDIVVLGLSGDRERRPLLTSQFNEYRPALSPDERWLAYQSDESGQNEIFVRPFPNVGTGKWQVSSGGGEEPKWSRDGRALFYLGPTSVMEAAVGDSTAFTHDTPEAVLDRAPYGFNALPPRRYDVSPDGQRFLMMKLPAAGTEADVPPPEIIVVTNWVEELKQRVPTK